MKIQRGFVISKLFRDNSVLYFTYILKLVFGMMALTHFSLLELNERTSKVGANKVDTLQLADICLIVFKHVGYC